MSDRNTQPPKVKVYLESRYRKLERGLPQTIFFCPTCKGNRRRAKRCEHCKGYGKLTKDSVQELLARRILPAFKARVSKFHGAGREDLDVLMLGRGRPFVFEVVGARNVDVALEDLDARLREELAGRVELDPLRIVERSRVPFWKESKFDKIYRTRVAVDGEFSHDSVDQLVGREVLIEQRTPSRVAYRRADLTRERTVVVLAAGEITDEGFDLDIRCAHGTYVKEWISGDEGRTTPSVTELLGAPCSCARLDVLEILTDERVSEAGVSDQ